MLIPKGLWNSHKIPKVRYFKRKFEAREELVTFL
jgi:hypothetical protein